VTPPYGQVSQPCGSEVQPSNSGSHCGFGHVMFEQFEPCVQCTSHAHDDMQFTPAVVVPPQLC
jgi:hypothetical protein